jgi:hypothetical protein
MKHDLRLQNIGRTQAKDTFYLISTADSPVLPSRPHDRATLGRYPQDHYNKRGIYNFFLIKKKEEKRGRERIWGGGGGGRG